MGQAVFAIDLVKPLEPASIRSIALCEKDDSVLRPMLEKHGVEVEVIEPPFARSVKDFPPDIRADLP